ncbi:hypothetical protein GJ744_002970 [Endocarpon pusillum]|uniref:Uncharacterized protein n=1 Tax=Endocarpon pusillum TaxID=364733 RepID=A0A8H7AEV6_9EURO|nr:hypothetical protein GJ744_002970 [Endocarpon pusillum]
MAPVQRWDGRAREARDWNELRRDPELFFPNGNTLIYLFSRGRSQRGPSFRIPYEFLLYSGCRPLVEQSLISTLAGSPYEEKEYPSRTSESYLYLHCPQHLSREDSFAYHVTTRNFFAWLAGVPIVGYDPVSALLALKDRMDIWRDEGSDNMKAICDYIREQGYGDISELEARLPPTSKPTMYGERSPQFEVIPTLTNSLGRSGSVSPTLTNSLTNSLRRSGSVASARQLLRSKVRFSGNFSHRPHIAELIPEVIRPQKKDQVPPPVPLREGHLALATIAYHDTLPDAPPSTTDRQPKPRHTWSVGRNSIYSEIIVPAFGNGLHNSTSTSEPTITSSPTTTIPQASPSEAYTRRFSRNPENDSQPPPSPPSSSSSICSHDSDVPSLSSTYSTEASDSPTITSPTLSTDNPFDDHERCQPEATACRMELVEVRIMDGDVDGGSADATGREPDLVIDTLMGELEATGLGGKPRYEALGMEKFAAGSGLGVSLS